MGHGDGGRHLLLCLIARKAKHHALVARADLLGILKGIVDAHGDVRALLVDGGHHRAGLVVKAAGRVVIADLTDGLTSHRGNVHIAVCRDFTHDKHHAGGRDGLTGHACLRVLGEDVVQHRVRDLIADFVGMSFCYGLRCKNSLVHVVPFLRKTPCRIRQGVWYTVSSSADFLAGFGTLQLQVAGFHRAGPSTTLDKGKIYIKIITFFSTKSMHDSPAADS